MSDSSTPAQRIGAYVRHVRLTQGRSQRDVATAAGMHRPNLARLEDGHGLPTLDTLARVGAALGVPVSMIVEAMG